MAREVPAAFAADALYTFDEAAEFLKKTHRQIQRYVYTGKLGYTKPLGSNQRLIRGTHIKAFLDAGEHAPAAR